MKNFPKSAANHNI